MAAPLGMNCSIRVDSIERKFPGGYQAFKEEFPHAPHHCDGELVVFASMDSMSTGLMMNDLIERFGFKILSDDVKGARHWEDVWLALHSEEAPPCDWIRCEDGWAHFVNR